MGPSEEAEVMSLDRVLDVGTRRFTEVVCMDEPGAGGACHKYKVRACPEPNTTEGVYATVSFQNGPINKYGVNGCHQEDLLAIVIDRLRGFQAGGFSCRENALALTKIEEAMHWLNHRTTARINRGVEGTSAK